MLLVILTRLKSFETNFGTKLNHSLMASKVFFREINTFIEDNIIKDKLSCNLSVLILF